MQKIQYCPVCTKVIQQINFSNCSVKKTGLLPCKMVPTCPCTSCSEDLRSLTGRFEPHNQFQTILKKKKNVNESIEYSDLTIKKIKQIYLQNNMRIQSLTFTDWWIKSHNYKGMRLVRLQKSQAHILDQDHVNRSIIKGTNDKIGIINIIYDNVF